MVVLYSGKGSTTVILAPPVSEGPMFIRPKLSSSISDTMDSPNPNPETVSSSREPLSITFEAASGVIPGPSSATSIVSPESVWLIETSISA